LVAGFGRQVRVATPRLHKSVRKTRQRACYAALSQRLSARAQLSDHFLSPNHQNYQAVIAELISEVRA